jgi:RecJ-like exonuclease
MHKSCFAFLAVGVVLALPLMAAELKLGKPLDIKTATPITDILANPEKYLGKDVMIEGEITNVCQNQGCWIDVKDASSAEVMQVKVNDGEIVFPKDSAGKKVAAQGRVEKMVLTKEQYIEKLKHDAQESGRKVDLTKVTGGATIYHLKGQGAVIK